MAQDINQVFILGRTTKDVELRTTTSGKTVANFTLANSGRNDETNFINCVAWEKTADILAKYATKGKQLAITGRLTTRKYEKDGKTQTATEVVVENVQLLGGKTEERSQDVVLEDIDDKPIDLSNVDIPF